MAATVDEVIDDLSDYADYEAIGSVSRAQTFITAAIRFLQFPTSASDQGSSHGFDAESIRQQLRHARAFVVANQASTNGSGPGVRYIGPDSDFRR